MGDPSRPPHLWVLTDAHPRTRLRAAPHGPPLATADADRDRRVVRTTHPTRDDRAPDARPRQLRRDRHDRCIRSATSDDFAEEVLSLSDASGRWVFETDQGGLLIDFDNTARLLLDKPSRWHHLAYCYSGDALDNTTLRHGETLYVRGEDVHLDVIVRAWRPATDDDPKTPQSPDRR